MAATAMRAIVNSEYGSAEGLQLQEIDKPMVPDNGVLVRVRAVSINPLDYHFMRGQPYIIRVGQGLRRPKTRVLGVDVAGHVEAVGKDATRFQPGDEVFGHHGAALAEYVCGQQANFAPKPAGLTFEQAAAIPVAGFSALQALRDKARLQEGQRLLINGASGGVGTFAVQIAKAFGAVTTAVCSTRNVALVQSLGADHVIDYTRDDFTRGGRRYDVILDNAASRPLSHLRRALAANGVVVLVGAGKGRWLGPVARPLAAVALSQLRRQKMLPFLAKPSQEDLIVLKDLIEAGKLSPVIDRVYQLGQAADAMSYLEKGHAPGKVVITV